MMRDLFEFVQREFQAGPLLVAARHNALGARLAHERLGVPLVGLYPTPGALRTCYDEPGLPIPEGNAWPLRLARGAVWWSIDQVADHFLLPTFNGYRRQLGLPAIRRPFHRWVESPGLNVGLFAECFSPIQPDWPANLVLAGFPVASTQETPPLPPRLTRFLDAGDAPIVFTRGSHVDMAPAFFAKAVEICRQLGRRAVLAGSAPGFDEQTLPATVCAPGFVSFDALLPRAAAIVHHGGIGTTALALASGIPQVVTPMFDDQFYNACRVARLGVGCRLARRDWSVSRFAETLETQLTSPQVRARCQQLASAVRRQSRLEEGCRAIERYGVQSANHILQSR
jgi:UDP:flavonoid glycosyltransferase YjiC (YdhE family)